jgi:hypothetical protein
VSDEENGPPPAAAPESAERSEVVTMSDQQIAALGAHIQSLANGIFATLPGHFEAFAAYLEALDRRMMFQNPKLHAQKAEEIRRSIKICHVLSATRSSIHEVMSARHIVGPGGFDPRGNGGKGGLVT